MSMMLLALRWLVVLRLVLDSSDILATERQRCAAKTSAPEDSETIKDGNQTWQVLTFRKGTELYGAAPHCMTQEIKDKLSGSEFWFMYAVTEDQSFAEYYFDFARKKTLAERGMKNFVKDMMQEAVADQSTWVKRT
eukprot:TRINITY_DN66139_c0_g1_i1.p1 TRINITY_DN66139_c0_g1~~TRINITY_DN66139_c0_g1_i1.p1  ORF type:complete len:136 (-),score=11.76 TRINITY_DN66139_c0_g1_i1:102-509(-)